MKRLMLVLLALLLALTLTACESENLKNAEALVAAIGQVTLESGDAIAAAEEAMALLTDKELEKFAENEGILIIARATYDGLRANQVADVVGAVSGEITFASEEAILAARELLDSLPEDMVNQSDLDALEAAEAAYAAYCDAVDAAEEQIAAIGEVKLSSGEVIAAARAVFDALTEEQQAAVENADVLTAAEGELIAQKEEVTAVSALIAAFEQVTVDDEADVAAVREAFDALDEEQQAAVENESVLIAAEVTLAGYAAEIAMVSEMIASIGDVTADSEDGILATRAAYEALAEDLKPYVENLADLEAAEAVLMETKAGEIEALIAAIPAEPDADSVAAARAAYDAAGPEIAALVENYSVLTGAEEAYAEACVAAQEQAFLAEMAALFEAYGMAMPESGEEILDAAAALAGKIDVNAGERLAAVRTSFQSLSAESQGKLAVYYEALAVLESAYADGKAAARQATIDAMMKKMRVEEDRVQGYTWISSKTEPQYSDDRCFLMPYIGQSNSYGNYWLIIRYNYTYDSWVFFEKITIVTDEKKYTFSVDYFDVMRDNDYGVVWEVYDDTAVSDADIAMLRDIASSSEVIVRFEGDDYYWDFTVPAKDKTAITEVVDLFEALTGK